MSCRQPIANNAHTLTTRPPHTRMLPGSAPLRSRLCVGCTSLTNIRPTRRRDREGALLRDEVSMRNFRYLPWLERLEKLAGAIMIEHRIGSFDTQKETVAAGQRESRHVERGMVRHRQPAKTQQAQHRR